MLSLTTPIKARLQALAPLAGWYVRSEDVNADRTKLPAADVRCSGAQATDSETVAVTLDPVYTVTLAVNRGPTAVDELEAAMASVIGSLHNWCPGSAGGVHWRRMALQVVRAADFDPTGSVAYELTFACSGVYHGAKTGA